MEPVTRPRWRQGWLPLRPLASDDLREGIYRMSRSAALNRRYIEANPQAMSNLLVVDIDHGDSMLRALSHRAHWLPNAVVENPRNGHAHAVWALAEPVTRTEYARRAPLAFAAAVTEGLRRSVDGDQGYSGLITKNPVHDDWNGQWVTSHLYELDELAHHLDEDGFLPAPSWKRSKRRNSVGLGRNCALFETARTWAYPRVRDFHERTPEASAALRAVIEAHAIERNADYPEPLPIKEALGIAHSIHRWITTKSRLWLDGHHVNQATFARIQSARNRKSAAVRRENVNARILEMINHA